MSDAPWLLLRGLMRETRHWGDFPARLAAAGQTSVYTLDLAGNGRRYHETSGATVPAMADDVAEQWQRMRGGPVKILALSLGGMVAVEWARRAPQTVAELVLCNSSIRPYSTPWERFQPRAMPKLLRLLLTRPEAQDIETDILRLTSNRADEHAAKLGDWVRWRQQCPVSGGNVLRQLLAAARYRAASAPAVPTRVLCAAGDRLVSPRCSQRLAAAWQVPLAVHPSAGHDLPLDDPEWLLAQLKVNR
jgi:pimeloyl-ACP methyl ester carboxylesterase